MGVFFFIVRMTSPWPIGVYIMVKTLNMVGILGDIEYGSEVIDVHPPINSPITRFHDDWGISHYEGPFLIFAAIIIVIANTY